MNDNRKKSAAGILTGVVVALVVLFAVGLIVIYTGGYNVAASAGHSAFGRWVLSTTMHNSVRGRAAGIDAPPFTDAMAASGAGDYKNMCEHCHAGPGVDRAEWAEGILPHPPELTDAAAEWESEEIFWIVRHGIKMSGMPAFGPTHDEETLWNIVAFVSDLPGMTPPTYQSLGDAGHHADEPRGQPAEPAAGASTDSAQEEEREER